MLFSTEAEKAARQIGTSMLFKTMLAGADPNWGRLVAAIGASDKLKAITFRILDLPFTNNDAAPICK